jgi:putative toxin-antitoxin system antitoxin component (TIGR02293 family)
MSYMEPKDKEEITEKKAITGVKHWDLSSVEDELDNAGIVSGAMIEADYVMSLIDLLDDKILIIQTIENGLLYKSFEMISAHTPFNQAFWAEVLGLSTKSLNRYKQTGKKFKPLQSEKIIELAEVSNMGKKVFENDNDFELWLNTPSIALGRKKPIDLIKTSYGKELVLTELINIDQGIFV